MQYEYLYPNRNTVFVETNTRKKEKMHDVCKVSAMYKDYSLETYAYQHTKNINLHIIDMFTVVKLGESPRDLEQVAAVVSIKIPPR